MSDFPVLTANSFWDPVCAHHICSILTRQCPLLSLLGLCAPFFFGLFWYLWSLACLLRICLLFFFVAGVCLLCFVVEWVCVGGFLFACLLSSPRACVRRRQVQCCSLPCPPLVCLFWVLLLACCARVMSLALLVRRVVGWHACMMMRLRLLRPLPCSF